MTRKLSVRGVLLAFVLLMFVPSPEAALINIRQIAGGSANQLLGTAGAGGTTEWKTLSGTTNQISISNAAGSITLSTPQDIATSSSPVFDALGLGTTPATDRKLDIEKGHIRFGQVAAAGAPTVALGSASGLTGTYYYNVTFVTALGETEGGIDSAAIAPSNRKVDLSSIPTSADSAVTARKIYRTTAGGLVVRKQLVTTINDNTTTTYTDSTVDGSLGASEPQVNSTGGLIYNGAVRAGIIDNGTTAIGIGALANNVGYVNTAVGVTALENNTTGYGNTAVGRRALRANTTGYRNVAIGGSALVTNTTGYHNIAVGLDALFDNLTGYYNVAVGIFANENNTSGFGNVSVGAESLQANTTGAFNTAVGTGALKAVVTNSGNTAIGGDALSVATGTSNTAVGRRALAAMTSGVGNVALGLEAGDTVTTGGYNIIIGTLAGDNITTGSTNIVIGTNIDAPSATTNNQMTIGNIIFATDVDGSGTTISTGNVGIKIASPLSGLHVANGSYVQFENRGAGAPTAGDCDSDTEYGRLFIDTTNERLYVCNGATRGWDYIALTN